MFEISETCDFCMNIMYGYICFDFDIGKPYFSLQIRMEIVTKYLETSLVLDDSRISNGTKEQLLEFQRKFPCSIITTLFSKTYYHYGVHSGLNRNAVNMLLRVISEWLNKPIDCEYSITPSHYPERFIENEKRDSEIE